MATEVELRYTSNDKMTTNKNAMTLLYLRLLPGEPVPSQTPSAVNGYLLTIHCCLLMVATLLLIFKYCCTGMIIHPDKNEYKK